jgi:hypothetical protein
MFTSCLTLTTYCLTEAQPLKKMLILQEGGLSKSETREPEKGSQKWAAHDSIAVGQSHQATLMEPQQKQWGVS